MHSPNLNHLIFLAGGIIALFLWSRGRSGYSRFLSLLRIGHQDLTAPNDPTQSTQRPTRLSPVWSATPETETDVDIIAIHGLDTKSPKTWEWRANNPKDHGVNWLIDADMLPNKVGRVRIFTCDWPADLLQKPVSVPTTLDESAHFLLDCVRQHLKANAKVGKDRPILFIASCLGGIILIKALDLDVNSSDRDESEVPSLRTATRGIVFLGTPFGGTAFKDMPDLAVKVWAMLQDKAVTALSENTKGETSALDGLVRSFISLMQEKDYYVFTFYEAHMTSLLGKIHLAWMFSNRMSLFWPVVLACAWSFDAFSPWLLTSYFLWLLGYSRFQPKQLVDKKSASASFFETSALNRSHVLMNKFRGPTCEDYTRVVDKIANVLEQIRTERSPLEQADAWIRDSCYTPERLRIERLSGKTLPMEQCYINLTIVKQVHSDPDRPDRSEKGDTPHRTSPFSLHARLKIETPNENIQVKLPTIFDPHKGSDGQTKSARRILIRGQAGVGKTTLCKKIVHDFVHTRTWNTLFDRILWVPLRNLKAVENGPLNFEELFNFEYFGQHSDRDQLHLANQLWKSFKGTKGPRTLFVLDGLDEIAQDLDHRKQHKFEFLMELLNHPSVVIMSRPYGKLPSGLRPFDLELETVGFNPDQVKAYVKQAFTNSETCETTSKKMEIQSFLQRNQLVRDLVRIPIQLDALCYIYDFGGKAVPQTMTGFYQAIEQRLWKKDVLRLEKQHEGKPVTQSHIDDESYSIKDLVEGEILFLESLAFTGLHNEIIEFESEDQIRIFETFKVPGQPIVPGKTLPNLSFLRTSSPSNSKGVRNYHFLHLTFQEYFAARYFVRQWKAQRPLKCLGLSNGECQETKPVCFLRKEKYNARYDIMWRFIAGLLQVEASQFFKEIENEPLDLLGPAHHRLLMHCFNEIKMPEQHQIEQYRTNMEHRLFQWLYFECEKRGPCMLWSEMECPERLFDRLLLEGSENVKMEALKALRIRRNLSSAMIKKVTNLYNSSMSTGLKELIMYVLSSHLEASPREIVDLLNSSLKDHDSGVRSNAALSLSMVSNPPEDLLTTLLSAALNGEDESVRKSAANALSWQSNLPDEILHTLSLTLNDENESVSYNAAIVLSRQSNLPDEILHTLSLALNDENESVSYNAAMALSQQSNLPDEIIHTLSLALNDENVYVRANAAMVLSRQSNLPDEILHTLNLALNDENESVSYNAAMTLSQQSNLPDEIIHALGLALNDKDWHVRGNAAMVLIQQSNLPDEILHTLSLALNDEDEFVRDNAAKALSWQSNLPDEIIHALGLALNDKDWYVRARAARFFGNVSTLSDEIVASLINLLNDMNTQVQAERALRSQDSFYSSVPSLDAESLKIWWSVLFNRSFDEQVSCCVLNEKLYIDMPEGQREVRFEDAHQRERFLQVVQEASADLGVPCQTWKDR